MSVRRLGELAEREARNKIYGVVVGVVTRNNHPLGKYMVQVRFPWLDDTYESDWARIATIGAGGNFPDLGSEAHKHWDKDGKDVGDAYEKSYGVYWLPNVQDQVLVAFEQGDISRPFVIGGLWTDKEKPLVKSNTKDDQDAKTEVKAQSDADKAQDKKAIGRNVRVIQSCALSQLKFDDTKDKVSVTLESGNKKSFIKLDDEAHRIIISASDGKNDKKKGQNLIIDIKNKKITITSEGGQIHLHADEISLTAKKNITMDSGEDTNIVAGGNGRFIVGKQAEITSGGTSTFIADDTMTLKGGPKIQMNPSSAPKKTDGDKKKKCKDDF